MRSKIILEKHANSWILIKSIVVISVQLNNHQVPKPNVSGYTDGNVLGKTELFKHLSPNPAAFL